MPATSRRFLIPAVIVALVLLAAGSAAFLRTKQPSEEASSVADTPTTPVLQQYLEVENSCGIAFQGTCVNMRAGPGTEYPVVLHLRTGIVLKVAATVKGTDGQLWDKIAFDGEIRYPERITGDWYVAKANVRSFTDAGDSELQTGAPAVSGKKRIVVDRSEQMLYAYDGEILFMKEPISTGLELTPTPRGTFSVYKKTPSRYMQGPLPGISDQYYDLPGVPWNLYFTYQGAVIHGAYWHNNFGEPWSHGCVNLPPEKAKELYQWADLGTKVTVQD